MTAPGSDRLSEIDKQRSGRKPFCMGCRVCLFELLEYKVHGDTRLPEFLQMLGSLALPTTDVYLDWSVMFSWFMKGDTHWFEFALSINVLGAGA